MNTDKPYAITGSLVSEQAEASTTNPAAGNVQMRMLIELQVLNMLLAGNIGTSAEDLRQLRQQAADSIT